jgi:outer membrane biosynthesis protein TonB
MRNWKTFTALLLCLLALGVGGCRKRSTQASAPIVIFPTQPEPAVVQPEPKPAEKPVTKEKPAEPIKEPTELVVPPAKKPAPRPAHSKPAQSTPENPPGETAAPKPTPPRITPGVSPAEQAKLQQEALDAIAIAEKNLKLAEGRNLNPAQRDLREKIQGFLAQAQEARNEGDWVRVRNLADKARVLSNELVNSL